MTMNKQSYQDAKAWRKYVHDCPAKSLLDMASGDIFYLKCANTSEMIQNTKIYDRPKFRPVMLVSGANILECPGLVQNLDTNSANDIDPNDIFGLPFTTSEDNDNNQKSKRITQYDIKLTDNYNLGYRVQPGKSSYFQPIDIYQVTKDDLIKEFDPYFTDPEPTPKSNPELFPRYIGHMDHDDLHRFLTDIGRQLTTMNHAMNQSHYRPDHPHLTKLATPPTEMHYRAFPSSIAGNPHFDQPAKNDPDSPDFLSP